MPFLELKVGGKNNMISVDDIFNLFPDRDSSSNNLTYIDLTDTPTYWLGMHKKLVLNHINFKKKVIAFFSKNNKELDPIDIEKAGEFVAYNRAWFYIKKIDIENENHLADLISYGDEDLRASLELAIQHFQHIEEYEKCAHLLKILKKSQEFQF